MKGHPARVLVFSFVLSLSGAAALAPAEQISATKATYPANIPPTHFVQIEAFDFSRILPAPPTPDSLAAKADLEAVLQVQAWRTTEQVVWAKLVDEKIRSVLMSADVEILGPWFAPEKFPEIVVLTSAVVADVTSVALAAKNVHHRLRPFAADERVHPCVGRPANGSYPSGHTAIAFAWAATMTELFPGKRAEFAERAHRIAWGRVIGGVHFPTDLEGGRLLAAAIMAEMNKSDAFRAAVERCRTEINPLFVKKAA